ncbi:Txe/YoeB family addiction module toxin [Paracidovorax citrulli]
MTRSVLFTAIAWEGYLHWQQQDKKTLKRINTLIQDAQRHPFEGIGKPEGLKGNLSGFWSRRIDDVNRLVYLADDESLRIVSCRFHYGDR